MYIKFRESFFIANPFLYVPFMDIIIFHIKNRKNNCPYTFSCHVFNNIRLFVINNFSKLYCTFFFSIKICFYDMINFKSGTTNSHNFQALLSNSLLLCSAPITRTYLKYIFLMSLYNKKKFQIRYVYYPLYILMYLSILSGFIYQDIFIGIGSDFFSKDIFINPSQNLRFLESSFETSFFFKKYLPFILTLFSFFFFEYLNFFLKNNLKIYYFFKLKLYFDFTYNYILLKLKKISFIIFFNLIDKGILEILGPNGILRHCW